MSNETIEINKEDLIDFLWGVLLADHLGDVWDDINVLTRPLGIEGLYGDELQAKLEELDLMPDYMRD